MENSDFAYFFLQRFLRDHQHELTSAELAVWLFVFDRTLGWRRNSEIITLHQFTHGVRGKDNRSWHRGTGLSRSTVLRSLATLQSRNIIFGETHGQLQRWSLNRGWRGNDSDTPICAGKSSPQSENITDCEEESGEGVIMTPARCQSEPGTGVILTPDRCQNDTQRKKSEERTQERTIGRAVPGNCSGTDAVAETAAKHSEVVNNKLAIDRMEPSPINLFTVWERAFVETYPGEVAPGWSGKDKGMIKSGFVKRVSVPDGDYAALLDWSVRNWGMIIAGAFGWMKQGHPPERPLVGFFVGMVQHFVEAYAGRERIKREASLSFVEREVRAMVRRGYSEEDAKAEIERRHENSRGRQRLREQEKQTALMVRAARLVRPVPLPVNAGKPAFRRRPFLGAK